MPLARSLALFFGAVVATSRAINKTFVVIAVIFDVLAAVCANEFKGLTTGRRFACPLATVAILLTAFHGTKFLPRESWLKLLAALPTLHGCSLRRSQVAATPTILAPLSAPKMYAMKAGGSSKMTHEPRISVPSAQSAVMTKSLITTFSLLEFADFAGTFVMSAVVAFHAAVNFRLVFGLEKTSAVCAFLNHGGNLRLFVEEVKERL